METIRIRRNEEISETEMIKREYGKAVSMFIEVGNTFDRMGFKVSADPNQLTMEFYDLSDKQEKSLLDFVKSVNHSHGHKISLIPENGMYLLYFTRGADGYAYVSNPMRPRETQEQAGTPQLGIPEALELARGLRISTEKMRELIRA